MPKGKYLVRIIVNGNYIPLYQYSSLDKAYITVSESSTPRIASITPTKGVPGTFVDITGDFKVKINF